MGTGQDSRRDFLLRSASGLSSAWVALHWPAILDAHEHARQAATSAQGKFEFFSQTEAAEVEAMAAQIIPSDSAPGAREAGVVYFIDRALTTFDRQRQAAYREGLTMLQSRVGEMFPGALRFSSLHNQQQIQLLTAIEKTDFFETVRVHTIMGFLSDPDYGGNRNQVGWKLIGFEQRPSFRPPFGYYDSEEQR
jgi:gluconate 2-dehydrogenase gamma chain